MGKMHANVYKLLPNTELVAAVDHKPEHLDAYCTQFGCEGFVEFEEMIAQAKPDVVDICLPTFLHKEYTVRAAQAGRHVVCEKPIALTVEDADAMIEACECAGVKLMIAHCIRFWPEYALLKQITDERRLGCLLSLNLTRLGEFPSWSSDNWLASEEKSGGGVLDMHIHDTDFALYLLGEPKSIAAFGTINDTGPAFTFTTLEYDGAVVHLEGGWNLPKGTPFKMSFRAIYERGTAIWDCGPMTVIEQGKPPEQVEFPKMEASGGGNVSDLGGYYLELKYFMDCLEAGRDPEIVAPETSRASLAVVLEEIRQIKTRNSAGSCRD